VGSVIVIVGDEVKVTNEGERRSCGSTQFDDTEGRNVDKSDRVNLLDSATITGFDSP